ncbi:MAG: YlbF family regulator [bacterium]
MNNLIDSLQELDEVKKYKRLEKLIDENLEYRTKVKKLYDCQKQMVNSKHYGLENNYFIYLEEYNKMKKELEDDILINMYLESLEEVNSLLEMVSSIISNKVNEKLID